MFENEENIVFGKKTQFLMTCLGNGSKRKENIFSLRELNDEEGLERRTQDSNSLPHIPYFRGQTIHNGK